MPQSLIQSADSHLWRKAQMLVSLHTVESTRRLYRLVEDGRTDGRATIQKGAFPYRGRCWQVSFHVHYQLTHSRTPKPPRQLGDVVSVELGVKHLATLSQPAPGVTSEAGHVSNLKVPQQHP